MIHKKVKKNTDFLGLFVLTTVSEAGFFFVIFECQRSTSML